MRHLAAILMLASTLALAGCGGGGGGGGPTAPGGNSEVESNDFAPQSIGTLAGADIVYTGTSASQADVDLYTVTLGATTNLFVSVNWSNSNDLELSISNSAGIFVRTVDSASHPESCTLNGLPPGTYTIRIGSFSSGATGYTLTVGPR